MVHVNHPLRQAHDFKHSHWAYSIAEALIRHRPTKTRYVVQTSMSPSGFFHAGNLRDTICAYLIAKALCGMGRRVRLLLSFDDYDPFRDHLNPVCEVNENVQGLPQGLVVKHVTTICNKYLAELESLGISDQSTSPSEDGFDFVVHHQISRYRSGKYDGLIKKCLLRIRRVAKFLAIKPRELFIVYCRQCGRRYTNVTRVTKRGVEYYCSFCGAIDSADSGDVIKPKWKLDWILRCACEGIDCEPAGTDHCSAGSTVDTTRQAFPKIFGVSQPVIVPYGDVRAPGGRRRISGSSGGGISASELLDSFPRVIVLWIYSWPLPAETIYLSLSKGHYYSLNDLFDRWCKTRAKEKEAVLQLLAEDPQQILECHVPRIRKVVGHLHSSFYDTALASTHLCKEVDSKCSSLFEDRKKCAKRWLSKYARDYTWICSPANRATRAELEIAAGNISERSVSSLRISREFFYPALFGTKSGPPQRSVISYFGNDPVRDALYSFKAVQSHSLRDAVIANLDNL